MCASCHGVDSSHDGSTHHRYMYNVYHFHKSKPFVTLFCKKIYIPGLIFTFTGIQCYTHEQLRFILTLEYVKDSIWQMISLHAVKNNKTWIDNVLINHVCIPCLTPRVAPSHRADLISNGLVFNLVFEDVGKVIIFHKQMLALSCLAELNRHPASGPDQYTVRIFSSKSCVFVRQKLCIFFNFVRDSDSKCKLARKY